MRQFGNKIPKLDAAFSQVSRHTYLAFEYMGALSEAMNKRMDFLLKSWYSTVESLKPAMAVTVVAHNVDFLLAQMQTHIEEGTQSEFYPLHMLFWGIAYIADASAESVRMAARSSALSSAARAL